jgi:hypothetical protein
VNTIHRYCELFRPLFWLLQTAIEHCLSLLTTLETIVQHYGTLLFIEPLSMCHAMRRVRVWVCGSGSRQWTRGLARRSFLSNMLLWTNECKFPFLSMCLVCDHGPWMHWPHAPPPGFATPVCDMLTIAVARPWPLESFAKCISWLPLKGSSRTQVPGISR